MPVAQAALVRGGFVESLRKRMLRVTHITPPMNDTV
jgi:hypothetical protein